MSTLWGGIDASLGEFLGLRGLHVGLCSYVGFIIFVGGIFLLQHSITGGALYVFVALETSGGVHHCFDDDSHDCTGDVNLEINSGAIWW